MAVDSRDKRFALISLGLWRGRVLPNPTGAFDLAWDRLHLALLYPHEAFVLGAFLPFYGVNANKITGIEIVAPE